MPEPRRGCVVQGQGGRWPGFLLGFLTGPPSPLRREMALPPADKVSTAVSAGPMWQPMRGGSVGAGAAAPELQRYHIHLLFTHATRQHIHATGLQLALRESLYAYYCPSPSFATQRQAAPPLPLSPGLVCPHICQSHPSGPWRLELRVEHLRLQVGQLHRHHLARLPQQLQREGRPQLACSHVGGGGAAARRQHHEQCEGTCHSCRRAL